MSGGGLVSDEMQRDEYQRSGTRRGRVWLTQNEKGERHWLSNEDLERERVVEWTSLQEPSIR